MLASSHIQTTSEECVTGSSRSPISFITLEQGSFPFDIHILIKKMLLICMESFKKMSKQNAITRQTTTCDCGLLTAVQDFACGAREEMRTTSVHECHFS